MIQPVENRALDLRRRETTLRAEIRAAELKAQRITDSIRIRREALARLQAKAVLADGDAAVRHDHG